MLGRFLGGLLLHGGSQTQRMSDETFPVPWLRVLESPNSCPRQGRLFHDMTGPVGGNRQSWNAHDFVTAWAASCHYYTETGRQASAASASFGGGRAATPAWVTGLGD